MLLNDKNLTMKGRPNTQRRLQRTRVLLVLDDVDASSQLQYLIEENIILGPRSKVIITSRDRHVLVSGGVHLLHEVKELNMKESLQLFCSYAFKQGHPKHGYEKLSMQAIEYARGLPLALKVLGSYLNSRNTKVWESALKKFRKYPNVEIQSALRVSYDGLDIAERMTFLDIAFFFKGDKKENIIRVLDACDDFHAYCGIDGLLDKALISISRDNRVEIHDLLQEMAEEIVREESRGHPEKRSRLNDAKEIQDVLKNSKGTDAIQGITLNTSELENNLYLLGADSFEKMSNLRFLQIKRGLVEIKSHSQGYHDVHILFRLKSLPDKLRFLHWHGYPLKSLPLGFCTKKIVELHMPRSNVAKLWDGAQDLMNLKIIDLRCSLELEELPDFSMAQNLEEVQLAFCQKLCSIHPSMLSLPKLISLDLSYCINIKNLHTNNHLKSLKHLMVNGCFALKQFSLSSEEMRSLNLMSSNLETLNLPIGRYNKLEELYLGGCLKSFQVNELSCLTSLKKFSLSYFRGGIDKSKLVILFDAWRSLEELHLNDCMVSKIPDNINGLSLLKILSLRRCSVKSLPNSIKQLSELKQIDLGECKRLRCLPELPPSITHFYVNECTSLETTILRSTMFEHDHKQSFFSSGVKALEWGLDGCDILTEFFHFEVMQAIYNNSSCEVEGFYPGSSIPKGFQYSRTTERTITIELAPPSSHRLLGFASFCILSPLDLTFGMTMSRTFHLKDEEIKYKDEKLLTHLGKKLSTDHVFVWYKPMERILKESQRRRYDEGTTTYKIACEFLITRDRSLKGCGIWPIYASELQKAVQQIEVMLEKGSVTRNSSGPSEKPNAEVAQHQPAARASVKRGTWMRQKTWTGTTSRLLRNKRNRYE